MAREQIRARLIASQSERKLVPVMEPGWEDVYVRRMTAGENLELTEGVDNATGTFRVLMFCLVDEHGERIFGDEDLEVAKGFPSDVFMRVFAEVAKLNGVSSKELEEAVADFASAPDEQRSTA